MQVIRSCEGELAAEDLHQLRRWGCDKASRDEGQAHTNSSAARGQAEGLWRRVVQALWHSSKMRQDPGTAASHATSCAKRVRGSSPPCQHCSEADLARASHAPAQGARDSPARGSAMFPKRMLSLAAALGQLARDDCEE